MNGFKKTMEFRSLSCTLRVGALVLLAVFSSISQSQAKWPFPDRQGCSCTQIYTPVCGIDGHTYGNVCEARCNAVRIRHVGECYQREQQCRANSNSCPDGEICYLPTGKCQPPCELQCFEYDPVCGTDGVTYGCGAADAFCHGVKVVYEGECRNDCICPQIWAPVCGTDGQIYANGCEAKCAGVETIKKGACSNSRLFSK